MELSITSQTPNKLLKRTTVALRAGYTTQKTPSRQEVRDAVAKKTGKDASTVAIELIDTKFGDAQAKVIAQIYDSAKDLENYEQKPIQKRHQPKVAKTA